MNLSNLLLAVGLLAGQASAAVLNADDMSMEELERSFGANLLEVDPAGLNPPAGVRDNLVLRRWYGSEPSSLNAVLWSDANLNDSVIVYCVMDPVVKQRHDPSKWAPGVADYAGVSEDGRKVTVRLKPGIHWQFPAVDRDDPKYAWLVELFKDGAPELTAADFAFTLKVIQHKDAGISYASYVEAATIEVIDRYTYQMNWSETYVYAFDFSATWPQVLPEFLYSRDESGRVLDDAELGTYFTQHWHNHKVCGYGPYEFVGMDPNEQIVLRRKDDFHPVRPAIQEIQWKIISDSEQVVLNLLDDQLDYITFMPDQYRKWVVRPGAGSPFRDAKYTLKPYDKLEYLYLGWNCRRKPLDDKQVRIALAYAFNREAFLKNQFNGLGDLVDTHVFHDHPHCNKDLRPIPFDLDVASGLLDEAGFGDEDGDGVRDKLIDGKKVDLSFTMKVFKESNELQSLLAIYREDLLSIGVDMKVEVVPWAELFPQMRSRDFDAYTGLWGLGWTLTFTNAFHSDSIGDGSNYVGFSNPEADKLIHAYTYGVLDDDKRRAMALRIQEIIYDEQPYLFFMRRSRVTAYHSWLKGVEYSAARPQLLSFPWYAE